MSAPAVVAASTSSLSQCRAELTTRDELVMIASKLNAAYVQILTYAQLFVIVE
jgi:hypothetical protein